jgi:hypothetical protein
VKDEEDGTMAETTLTTCAKCGKRGEMAVDQTDPGMDEMAIDSRGLVARNEHVCGECLERAEDGRGQAEDAGDSSDRYFPGATAEQLEAAALACRAVPEDADSDWDAPEAECARQHTAALGWSWDFSTWSHAASILEREAADVPKS